MKLAFLAFLVAAPVTAPPPKMPPIRETQAPARSILFVGNSFTQGAFSPVQQYRADAVTDLNGTGIGGVPALFKTFAEQAGIDWSVALETQGGSTLAFHHDERRDRLHGRYDVVVLQEYSTLDPARPGDPASYDMNARRLARLVTGLNPTVEVLLMATWSRADQVYRSGTPWSGKPIEEMATELRAAANAIDRSSPEVDGVIPVGEAWNRAMRSGFADANPYDGVSAGQVSLWASDHYHGSVYGSYLQALTVFGRVTGIDPLTLGAGERAAAELGISKARVTRMQAIASAQLAAERRTTGRVRTAPPARAEQSR